VRPQGTRVLAREQRHAWRGYKRGRRLSHQVRTTYGRGQELADRIAWFSASCAERRERVS
jgi:hypothetical protein